MANLENKYHIFGTDIKAWLIIELINLILLEILLTVILMFV